MKKRLTQKLQQLIDKLPSGNKRKEAKSDLLKLKLSNSDYHFISLADKYKENLQQTSILYYLSIVPNNIQTETKLFSYHNIQSRSSL